MKKGIANQVTKKDTKYRKKLTASIGIADQVMNIICQTQRSFSALQCIKRTP